MKGLRSKATSKLLKTQTLRMRVKSHSDWSSKNAILRPNSIVTQLKLPSPYARPSRFRPDADARPPFVLRSRPWPHPTLVPGTCAVSFAGFPALRVRQDGCLRIERVAEAPSLLFALQRCLRSSGSLQTLCTKAPPEDDSLPPIPVSPYEDEPWKYLDSEEYHNRYGSRPVWADYRRNHKGGIPPQRTRKMCIRGNKVAGNPCPICRDQKLHVDFRNVKLLKQFVCAHTGIIFHAPYTGVCMKQHKKLTQAIQKARDHGLLSYHIPQVEPRDLDFSTSHGAVSATPPAPTLVSGDPWYPWYSWKQPPERELSRLRRLYQGHLREESGPPPESMPKVPLTAPTEATSTEQAGPQSAL